MAQDSFAPIPDTLLEEQQLQALTDKVNRLRTAVDLRPATVAEMLNFAEEYPEEAAQLKALDLRITEEAIASRPANGTLTDYLAWLDRQNSTPNQDSWTKEQAIASGLLTDDLAPIDGYMWADTTEGGSNWKVIPEDNSGAMETESLSPSEQLHADLNKLGYTDANWGRFLRFVIDSGGLPNRGSHEFYDKADDAYQAERLLSRGGDTLTKFISTVQKSGGSDLFEDQIDWLKNPAAQAIRNITWPEPLPDGDNGVTTTVRLQRPTDAPLPRFMTAEEGVDSGVITVINVNGQKIYQPALGYSWAYPNNKDNNYAVVRDDAPTNPESSDENNPTFESTSPSPLKDVPETSPTPVIKNESDFVYSMHENGWKRLATLDDKGDSGSIIVNIPSDKTNPDYLYSRIHHFIGKDESLKELPDPENYTVTINGQAAKWKATDYYKDGTWVNPDTDKRILVESGRTTIEWKKEETPQVVATEKPKEETPPEKPAEPAVAEAAPVEPDYLSESDLNWVAVQLANDQTVLAQAQARIAEADAKLAEKPLFDRKWVRQKAEAAQVLADYKPKVEEGTQTLLANQGSEYYAAIVGADDYAATRTALNLPLPEPEPAPVEAAPAKATDSAVVDADPGEVPPEGSDGTA